MLPEILSHVQSKQHFTRCFFKVWKLQKRAEQFMELFNLFELKILGYYLRVFRSSREFLLPPLTLAELCLGAYHARPAKRSCFALFSNTSLDGLNSRSHTMDRVQPLFFVSIKRCHHYFQAFWFIIFTFFIVYFVVEMLEQSVKLSRLIIFYFISNFLIYAPIVPNRVPKTSAFRSFFVFRVVFQLIHSCFGCESKCAANANHCGFCSKLVRSRSKFCAI